MRQEPLFTTDGKNIFDNQNNIKKFKIGYDFSQNNDYDLIIHKVLWSEVEIAEDSYNEEFLASLRDLYKEAEFKNLYVIIEAIANQPSWIDSNYSKADIDYHFTQALKHTARRVKDCTNVLGLYLGNSDFLDFSRTYFQQNFYDELSKKHKHYIFFAKSPAIDSFYNIEII